MSTEEILPDPSLELEAKQHTWLGEPGKSLFIPNWYVPHKRNVAVTQNDVPLGFTVKDVMPHRRWAIRPNGELIDQQAFMERYTEVLMTISGSHTTAEWQHIPRVERYVNAMPDPAGGPGFVPIGFDPSKKPDPGADDGQRYDPIRDAFVSLKEELQRSAKASRVDAMLALLSKGELTPEAMQRELEEMATAPATAVVEE